MAALSSPGISTSAAVGFDYPGCRRDGSRSKAWYLSSTSRCIISCAKSANSHGGRAAPAGPLRLNSFGSAEQLTLYAMLRSHGIEPDKKEVQIVFLGDSPVRLEALQTRHCRCDDGLDSPRYPRQKCRFQSPRSCRIVHGAIEARLGRRTAVETKARPSEKSRAGGDQGDSRS